MKSIGLCCLLFATACQLRAAESAPEQRPAGEAWLTQRQLQDSEIEVKEVGNHGVGGTVVTSGKVTFDDLRVSHVMSPVTGKVTRILASPGQRVKKGQSLATILSPDIGTAFSDLGKAKADFEAAERDYLRNKDLLKDHAVAEVVYETSLNNHEKTKAELARAQQKVKLLSRGQIDEVTQEYVVVAPLDGEVISRTTNPGVEVQGTYGGGTPTELFTIGEIDKVWVLADVFEMDLARIHKGAHVGVRTVAFPGREFPGQVDYVTSQIDRDSRTAKVRCAIDNPKRELRPEMYATASIAVGESKALSIPRSAILRVGEKTIVFVEKPGKAPGGQLRFERRAIAINEEESGEFVPVTSGLSPGERITTAGGILLLGLI
jgi:membrane fusion protein, heavy metal efflux system